MGGLRLLAGLALALFATGYYAIGMMFILGSPSEDGYGFAFGVFGMLGLCAPVLLLGLHIAFFSGAPSLRARAIMVAALVLCLLVALGAMLPHALGSAPNPEAGNVILGSALMSALFGWPMVRGLFQALMARKD